MNALSRFTQSLEEQNAVLGKARNAYLLKEAERKHFEAVLVRKAEGKSHAEKLVNAQSTPEWATFQKELARLEAVFEFQKLRYEILDKNWQAEYLGMKLDGATIKRMA